VIFAVLRVARFVALVAIVGLAGVMLYEAAEAPANQLFGKTLVHGPRTEKIVALTYDDGPNPPYTDRILDVLEQEHVHATFFVVGRAVRAYPEVVRREVRDGDAIGNHTWDHAHLILMTPAQIRASLERTDEAIERAAGIRPEIMRPPFGARDWQVLAVARSMGLVPVMWSVPLANDWLQPPPEVIARRILRNVHDGSIIVLHDGNRGIVCAGHSFPPGTCDREAEIEATRIIVTTLRREGYRFVTIPQMLALARAGH
jgi:peptidoglycan/xylan/chitin deacetylase (PgdA/CDA1 family)